MQVYLHRGNDMSGVEYLHYWSVETQSFTEDMKRATGFYTKMAADAVLFWLTAKHASAIVGDVKLDVAKVLK